jgi:GDPmannose 4,6-dehydratase
MKKALITGISGQDGSYLSEFLLSMGYEVHGVVRRNSVCSNQSTRLSSCYGSENLHLHYGDVTDLSSLITVMKDHKFDEVYNLAAQSHVKVSFEVPLNTSEVTGLGCLNVLYQASSSEMFGNEIDDDGFQRETTRMSPVSPYSCAKVFAYNVCKNYRNAYDMFISNGILFNHESPRRGENFVSSKIVDGVLSIALGEKSTLALGNLDATRDWGHAKDYVRAMWLILQHDVPDDFVCSTGKSHSVRDMCKYVFSKFNMNYEDYVVIDPKYFRPEELKNLKGDCSKLKTTLGWKPEYSFEDLLDEMILGSTKYHELEDRELV